jgi:hypothetical protein
MSGNPNPQHVPTDGLGVAAQIALSGGTGASALSTIVAAREYAITLSVSATGTYETTAALTAALQDIKGNAYTPSASNSFVARSENNPSAGSPAWYRPSAFAGYNADVASVAVSGGQPNATVSITALHPGTATVEVFFPTFDNTCTAQGAPFENVTNPNDGIYVRVNVTVIP